MLDLLAGLHRRAARGRAAGEPHREPRRHGGGRSTSRSRTARRSSTRSAATLVKNHAHWRAFETVFEVYFSLRGKQYAHRRRRRRPRPRRPRRRRDATAQGEGDQQGMRAAAAASALTPEELAEMLYQALLEGNEALMRAIARQAVRRFAGMEPGRPVGGTYYLYRTLRNLDLDGVLERLMEQARERRRRRPLTPLEERLEQRRVRDPHRAAEEGDRGRDPPPAGGRPRRRGDGHARCASRCPRTSTSCTPAARRWRSCARRSTR